jgi:hypothetical protein
MGRSLDDLLMDAIVVNCLWVVAFPLGGASPLTQPQKVMEAFRFQAADRPIQSTARDCRSELDDPGLPRLSLSDRATALARLVVEICLGLADGVQRG